MTVYIILLISFLLAWSLVGFALAILFLKFRWNLVGGFLLATFGWLPIVGLLGLLVFGIWTGKVSMSQIGLNEVELSQSENDYLASGIGFLLGMALGTFVGLWPRRNAEEKKERWARTWPLIRTFVAGGLAVLLAWGVFVLADWHASSKLKGLREKYAEQLATQEKLAPQQNKEAAAAHDDLLLSLMQESRPVWRGNVTDFQPMKTKFPEGFLLPDTKLLRAFVPGSKQINELRPLVDHYHEPLQQLPMLVLESDEQFQDWHPLVARLLAYDALVHLYDNDLDAVLLDLQLLRTMGTQLLDEQIDDCQSYQWFEFYRYLIFQAVLGKSSPVPADIYDEMLQPIPGLRLSIRRALKREMDESVVDWIDNLLAAPVVNNPTFSYWRMAAIERILYAENLPLIIEKMEQELDQYYVDEAQTYTPFGSISFPGFYNDYLWLDVTDFTGKMVFQTNFSASHFQRYEMVKLARQVATFQQKHDRYPDDDECLRMLSDVQMQAGIDLISFGKKNSDETVGVLIFLRRHHRLDDQMGIYLGDSFFRLVDYLQDLEIFDKDDANGRFIWKFDPQGQNMLKPTLPDFGEKAPVDPID
ncbi:hypothetical protein DTL42_07685 [Bremerella cremea]|uniref:Uncharacterized protein n=1 Tax=Bremerella cremea TaxID=1031537 RepID=A0A368KWG6_9BACT|nr:DUF998 domain-containing protein [Bremerella cremea]RCS52709.1 hypothetical protein DTL42_07685 [Bremerella cremea]